jgi:penicillin-binding protein 2
VPDPAWKRRALGEAWFAGDAVNLAIGQGYLAATPLQVAVAYAALASERALRAPLLVRAIVPGGGAPVQEYRAAERGRLPVNGENIAAIRTALKGVAASPRGTAFYAFNGYTVPVAAKTGSAENAGPSAHAWFAGYAPADNPRVVGRGADRRRPGEKRGRRAAGPPRVRSRARPVGLEALS